MNSETELRVLQPGPGKAGRGRSDSPLGPPEGGWSHHHLKFGLVASSTVRDYGLSIVLGYGVCGHLLQQLEETNTNSKVNKAD